MEEDLRALLLASSAVTALVGNRVTWLARPQGSALPAIVLMRVGGAEGMTQDGPDGLEVSRVQIDVYADSYSGSKITARAVVLALNGYGGGRMDFIEHESSHDLPEAGTNETQTLFRVSADFIINYWSN